jgi:hypothetical protein
VVHWLREFGARGVKVAAVNGSLITDRVLQLTDRILENGLPTSTLAPNADLGRGLPGCRAHRAGAEGGCADRHHRARGRPVDLHGADGLRVRLGPAGPHQAGRGNGLGHLLECGAQVTGGYFSDPGFKDVPEPWNFGFPIAEVTPTATPCSPRWPAPAAR